MSAEWLTTDLASVGEVIASGVCVYAAILVLTRLGGLRSFSKMSAADFAMTVAVGSIFASAVASPTPSVGRGVAALAVLFGGQVALAAVRRFSPWFQKLVDNRPLLLFEDGEFLDENLKRANVTRNDVFSKLREANAIRYQDVRAVVFEATGDVSVLHCADPTRQLEADFLQDVDR